MKRPPAFLVFAASLATLLLTQVQAQPAQDTVRVALQSHPDYGPFLPVQGGFYVPVRAETPASLPDGFAPADTIALDLQKEMALARAVRRGTADTLAAAAFERLGLTGGAADVLAEAVADPFVLAVASAPSEGGVWLLVDADNDEDLADEVPVWVGLSGEAVPVRVIYERVDSAIGAVVDVEAVVLVSAEQDGPDGPVYFGAAVPQHWTGRFEVAGQGYHVAGRPFGAPGTPLSSGTAEFVVAADGDSLRGPSPSNLPYHVGELVVLGPEAYELVAVADAGDELVLARRGPGSLAVSSRPGALAPEISGPLVGDGPFELSGLRGRYVVLDFWGTWCAPCVAALPALRSLHDAFGESGGDGVALVGVADDLGEAVAAFVEARGLTWPQLAGEHARSAAGQYAISAYPTAVVVGPDGRVLLRAQGEDAHPDRLAEFLSGALGPAGAERYMAYARSGNATVSVDLPGAMRPLIAGSFTEWGPVPMFEAEGGGWTRAFHLRPGRYEYKLIVDGEWVTDPGNPETAVDPEGHVNSVLVVE